MGRSSKGTGKARPIDIDILLYGNRIEHDGVELTIPHPRMAERRFVLVPLTELAPELVDPRSKRKFNDILLDLDKSQVVKVYSVKNFKPQNEPRKYL